MLEAASSHNSFPRKTVSGVALGSLLKLPLHYIQTSAILVISFLCHQIKQGLLLPSFLILPCFPLGRLFFVWMGVVTIRANIYEDLTPWQKLFQHLTFNPPKDSVRFIHQYLHLLEGNKVPSDYITSPMSFSWQVEQPRSTPRQCTSSFWKSQHIQEWKLGAMKRQLL